jgi:hypothetical protein
MRMEKHHSLVRAEKVLRLLRRKAAGRVVGIECWSNGREQGYCLNVTDGPVETWRSVVLAEQRSSDYVLVVPGPHAEFDMQTNHPSDAVWKDRQEFATDAEAAEFIAKFLCNRL